MQCLQSPQAAADWLQSMVVKCVPSEDSSRLATLQTDSRALQTGDVFLAYAGRRHDARSLVPQVLAQGARACLVDLQDADPLKQGELGQIFPGVSDETCEALVQDTRVAFMPDLKSSRGWVAAHYYGNPSHQLKVLAVTGTNGKTTCTWWLAQVLAKLGGRCALAGTLGLGELEWQAAKVGQGHEAAYRLKPLHSQQAFGAHVLGGLTTFEANELQHAMHFCRSERFTHMALEASSIGLKEGRLSGTQIEVAILTNLTQDHLDYHGDMVSYWQAKKALFAEMNPKAVVINLDDAHGLALYLELRLARQSGAQMKPHPQIVAYTNGVEKIRQALAGSAMASLAGLAHVNVDSLVNDILSADHIALRDDGTWAFELSWQGQRAAFELKVLGRYNVSNFLAVLGSLLALGVDWQQALSHCEELQAVSGRMQRMAREGTPTVVIDYAHTPDALTQVLTSLQEITKTQGAKLWCVMGCGGERDRSKRGLMGHAAQTLADHVVLTSDNPRHENPLAIIEDIASGMTPERAHRQVDRQLAIEWALSNAAQKDWVLVAGKGHESYQEVSGVRLPFSDHDVVARALERERANRANRASRSPLCTSAGRPS